MASDNELMVLCQALVNRRFESVHDAEQALEKFELLTTPAAVHKLIKANEVLRGLFKMHMETETREMRDLKAENERLHRFENAYKEFSDKTDWVVPDPARQELAMHVADILRKRCDDLTSHNQAQADEIKALRRDAERYRWLRARISASQYSVLGADLSSHTLDGVDVALDAAMAGERP